MTNTTASTSSTTTSTSDRHAAAATTGATSTGTTGSLTVAVTPAVGGSGTREYQPYVYPPQLPHQQPQQEMQHSAPASSVAHRDEEVIPSRGASSSSAPSPSSSSASSSSSSSSSASSSSAPYPRRGLGRFAPYHQKAASPAHELCVHAQLHCRSNCKALVTKSHRWQHAHRAKHQGCNCRWKEFKIISRERLKQQREHRERDKEIGITSAALANVTSTEPTQEQQTADSEGVSGNQAQAVEISNPQQASSTFSPHLYSQQVTQQQQQPHQQRTLRTSFSLSPLAVNISVPSSSQSHLAVRQHTTTAAHHSRSVSPSVVLASSYSHPHPPPPFAQYSLPEHSQTGTGPTPMLYSPYAHHPAASLPTSPPMGFPYNPYPARMPNPYYTANPGFSSSPTQQQPTHPTQQQQSQPQPQSEYYHPPPPLPYALPYHPFHLYQMAASLPYSNPNVPVPAAILASQSQRPPQQQPPSG